MSKFVLIVDDDDDVGVTLSVFLEMAGIKSIEAKSGNEALEILKHNKDIYFVISDVRMAHGSGVYLLEELRKLDPKLPYVVLISGQSDITKENAMTKGALELFQKPFNMDEIISLIKSKST